MNCEYPLHHPSICNHCNERIYSAFVVKNNEIVALTPYTEEIYDLTEFWQIKSKSEMINLIKQNCLTTIIVKTHSLEGPFSDDYSMTDPFYKGQAFDQLFEYVSIFLNLGDG